MILFQFAGFVAMVVYYPVMHKATIKEFVSAMKDYQDITDHLLQHHCNIFTGFL